MGRKKKSKESESKTVTLKKANFILIAPEAKKVSLAGNFNGWDVNAHPLKKNSKGTWQTKLELTPGKYEYRFLVDGKWENDPNCNSLSPNPFGGENCILTLLDVVVT